MVPHGSDFPPGGLLLLVGRFGRTSGSRSGGCSALLGALGRRGFFSRLGGSAFLRAFAGGGGFAFFFLFFDHLHLARSSSRSSSFGSLFFFRAWRSDGNHRDFFVTDDFNAGGSCNFAQVNRLADVQVTDIDG